jgi:hypothetical protein
MRILRVAKFLGKVLITYVVSWHVALAVFLSRGIVTGMSEDDLRVAYIYDVGQMFRVGGDELTDFVQRVALLMTLMGLLVVVVVRIKALWRERSSRSAEASLPVTR